MQTNKEQRDKFEAARLWAAKQWPYMAAGLWALRGPLWRPDLGTLAVDADGRLFIDPETADRWPVPALGTGLAHEAWHVLRNHAGRGRALGVTAGEQRRWNVCCDAEINPDLGRALDAVAAAMAPGRPAMPVDLGFAGGMLAEEYYGAPPEPPQQKPSQDAPGGAQDASGGPGQGSGQPAPGTPPKGSQGACGTPGDGEPGDGPGDDPGEQAEQAGGGSGSSGVPQEWEALRPGEECPGLTGGEKAQAAVEVAKAVQAAGRGSVPAGAARWADDRLEPAKVPWQRVLSGVLRRAVAEQAGQRDYTHARPSRRQHAAPGVLLPALRAPRLTAAVVIDTSGSMGDADTAAALAETRSVLKATGSDVQVIACDARADRAQRVTRTTAVQLVGGGGTDMGAGIAAALDLRPRPAVVVVLTDGDTGWPSDRPAVPVVVGLVRRTTCPTPPWARVVEAF